MEFYREDILSTLTRLGIDYEISGDWVRFKCANPAHDDKNPSAGIYLKTGLYNCYSCQLRTNIQKIVQLLLNCSYQEAKDFITGDRTYNIPVQKDKSIHKKKNGKKIKYEYELLTSPFSPFDYHYTNVRGYGKGFCEAYSIEVCLSNPYMDYIILPITDKKFNIDTFEARKLMQYEYLKKYYNINECFENLTKKFAEEKNEKEYKLTPKGIFDRDKNRIFNHILEYLLRPKVLYPPYSYVSNTIFDRENLDVNRDLYVSEGTATLPKLHKISNNVTCLFGSKVIEKQISILKNFKERIIIISDGDMASYEMIFNLNSRLPNIYIVDCTTEDTEPSFVGDIKQSKILKAGTYLKNISN